MTGYGSPTASDIDSAGHAWKSSGGKLWMWSYHMSTHQNAGYSTMTFTLPCNIAPGKNGLWNNTSNNYIVASLYGSGIGNVMEGGNYSVSIYSGIGWTGTNPSDGKTSTIFATASNSLGNSNTNPHIYHTTSTWTTTKLVVMIAARDIAAPAWGWATITNLWIVI